MNYLDQLDSNADFVAIDVETTGYSTQLDVIVEIGAIRYKNGVEIDRLVTLVKPATCMLPWITHLTGITDRMLAHAPSPSKVAGKLVKFLGYRPMVAHNAAFDVPIIERFLRRHAPGRYSGVDGLWSPSPVLCTLRLSRRLLPHIHSRRLKALVEYFNFEPRLGSRARYHRAGTDAEAAAHIFFCLASLRRRKE